MDKGKATPWRVRTHQQHFSWTWNRILCLRLGFYSLNATVTKSVSFAIEFPSALRRTWDMADMRLIRSGASCHLLGGRGGQDRCGLLLTASQACGCSQGAIGQG